MAGDEHSEPAWLDADESDAWLQLVQLTSWLPAALDAQLTRDAEVTSFEYAILAVLSEAPERTRTMSTLALLANGSLSRLSHVVKRLEARGWVCRSRSADSGRVKNAVLTDAGYAKVVESAPGHVAEVRRLTVDRLTRTQLRQLAAIGRRLNSARADRQPWRE
ncbi:MarR family transcriptional regulator [Actinoplanes sp. ATCC 53533]|uniref:MarR family winged helix-turn-helix transcriptional regulator n=1 Tax=Actinoplanes sp. ATCC 53533 TaxID=1288362 RepID=UPI000F7B2EBD|nr:MarR family transcriptional regulator [Actinoplanes sp. ATCC 53533]RSM70749.1 MarR family transcriptional regulator [Actinoplanes sp. ATCC 53533]